MESTGISSGGRLHSRSAFAAPARFGRSAERAPESPMRKTFSVLVVLALLSLPAWAGKKVTAPIWVLTILTGTSTSVGDSFTDHAAAVRAAQRLNTGDTDSWAT